MITDLIYRCPECGTFDWFEKASCLSCGVSADLSGRAALIIKGLKAPVSHWYDRVISFPLPLSETGEILRSKKIRLSREVGKGCYKGYGGMTATHYARESVDKGKLTLFTHGLQFSGHTEEKNISFESIISVTIESNTVIIVSITYGALFFDFLEESGKKWEDCIQRALSDHYVPARIIEFCPRIRIAGHIAGHKQKREGNGGGPRFVSWKNTKKTHNTYSLLVAFLRYIIKGIVKTVFDFKIEGLAHIPTRGPGIIMANHGSFLDGVILSVFPGRLIWFMSKNTPFSNPFLSFFLKIACSFPVRRYTTDVIAIRNAIRVIEGGHLLGIFPEGERSWNGKMLPFKHGTLRLALALGHPIIPVGISGAYALMPRWSSCIRRVPVTVRFGPPFFFEHVGISDQTQPHIHRASEKLGRHISALLEKEGHQI